MVLQCHPILYKYNCFFKNYGTPNCSKVDLLLVIFSYPFCQMLFREKNSVIFLYTDQGFWGIILNYYIFIYYINI